MKRRQLLQSASAALLATLPPLAPAAATEAFRRVRPGDPAWPGAARWAELGRAVGGRLAAVTSPLQACAQAPAAAACSALFQSLNNPYFIGDDVGLTQTLGWVGAWTSMPSAYAVAADTPADVVAAVDFARTHRLRLVVKGGGHSYQGTSNAADSLLVWTRGMRAITLHDAFVPAGGEGRIAPTRAVSVGAGALWSQVYDAVTTQAGGYVQGGGCLSVGVAGLVQSGGFGSFSKAYGTAAGSLLEAQVVTADGAVRIANAVQHPELFWGLKGGGGGSLGIVTRLTLRVHELPERFGAVNLSIRATSDAAFRRLVGLTMAFCARSLVNPHWGEQLRLRPDNRLTVSMVFQGLTSDEAGAVWQPFLDMLAAAPQDFELASSPFRFISTAARDFWSPTLLKRTLGFIRRDDRPGAAATNVFWPGDQSDAGHVLHAYDSAWLPAALLEPDRQAALADALFAASRHWGFSLHLNKGLAGAPQAALAAARDTAMNPAVLDAFALVIAGAEEPAAYPGIAGHEPDLPRARRNATALAAAMAELRRLVPNPGSYVSESNFFEHDWPLAFWGANHARLQAAKQRYDPEGLFFVHHGVGSQAWSADGFTRLEA